MATSGKKTIKIDAPIMKIQGAYVWMDRNWPIKFFDWMKCAIETKEIYKKLI